MRENRGTHRPRIMMHRHVSVCVMWGVVGGLLWWSGFLGSVGADEQDTREGVQDWPLVIAQLRQQLDRRPSYPETRTQLAVAYNNYAVSLSNQGRLTDAIQQLEEAIRLNPSNAQFQTNLSGIYLQAAHAAYQAHRVQEAREAIAHALEHNPNAVQAYVLLGELEYHSQHLKEAKAAWQKALAIDATLPDVQKRLEQLNQELPVESHFERLSQAYFDIRYTEHLDRSSGFDIRDSLLEARRQVGSDFACWPTGKLVVLVYSAAQFHQLRQETPDWVAGQYDGKIRLPLPGQGLDQAAVTRTLFHEYTHAIIHELTHNRCPIWFNEGLAEYEAWKQGIPPWLMLRQAFANNRLIPWSELSAKFSMASGAQEVSLAYEESHSIVRYLVERYGMWRVRQLLKAVAEQTPLEMALTSQLHTKPARLETAWQQWLGERLASPSH